MEVVMSLLFLILGVLIGALVLVEGILSDKELLLDSQPSSIESGFEKLWHVMFISSPFFMLAVLFVLFDMELILVIPSVFSQEGWHGIGCMHYLLVVILITLVLEWAMSGLKWHL